MRIFDIAMLVFMFNLALSVVNGLGITTIGLSGNALNGNEPNSWVSQEMSNIGTIAATPTSKGIDIQALFNYLGAFYQLALLAIPRLVIIFFNSTIGVGFLLMALGVPPVLAIPLWAAVEFIYFIGFYQMFAKSSFGEYS